MRPGTKPPFSVTGYDLVQDRESQVTFGGGRTCGPAVGKISAEIWFDDGENSFNTVQEAFDSQREVTWGITAGKNLVMYVTGTIIGFKCVGGYKNRDWATSEITIQLTYSPGFVNPCWQTEAEAEAEAEEGT